MKALFSRFLMILLLMAAASVHAQVNQPPQNFYVDPVTLHADWNAPGTGLYNRTTELLDYYVFMDDTLAGITTETEYDYDSLGLVYGTEHVAGVAAHYTSGFSDTVLYPFTCYYLPPITDLTVNCVSAPMLTWTDPGPFSHFILGYTIYRDGDFVYYIAINPGPPVVRTYIDVGLNPGIYWYTVSVVYDLSGFGFPGEAGESILAGPVGVTCAWGYHLPFYEDWSSGSFDENNWSTDAQNWEINGQQGLDPPCATFSWDPVLSNYEIGLESYPLDATDTTEGIIFVDFDLKLLSNDTSGTETMQLQVWNWENGMYTTIRTFENDTGSFDWQHFHVNIGILALEMVFKIRFLAQGDNTSHIQAWFIDNIEIYRECPPPENVEVIENFALSCIEVTWDPPDGILYEQWIHWDDGENYTSIGTDDSVEFDVAARWTPSQLSEFEGGILTKIVFFPGEAEAEYRIRIWTGTGPSNMILDQPVPDPGIGSHDTIELDTPVPLDISQELWVGYHVNTPTGYPAGCDDGPAIDGYGNMMNYEGGWQTLIQINSELDYNWNIMAYVAREGKELALSKNLPPRKTETSYPVRSRDLVYYEIYRSVDFGPFEFYDTSENELYQDFNYNGQSVYCYKVKAVYEGESDTCVSSFSNHACTPIYLNYEDLIRRSEVICFPNPANEYLTIKSSEEIEKVTIYSMIGENLLIKVTKSMEYPLDVRTLPSGVYFLRITTSSGDQCRKIVIMH